MPLTFNCPACGKELSAPDTAAGAAGVCRFCQASIIAPSSPGEPATLGAPKSAEPAPPTPPPPLTPPTPGPYAGQTPYTPPGPGFQPPGAGYAPPGPGAGIPPYGGYTGAPGNLAELWKRIVAFIIDGILIGFVVFIVTFPFRGTAPATQDPVEMLRALSASMVSQFISFVIYVAYGGFMESTYGATLGKMALRLRVTDTSGQQISLGKAVLRNVVKQITGICCLLYLVFFFTPLRQALHDMAAATLVLED